MDLPFSTDDSPPTDDGGQRLASEILVVDDEPVVRELLARILARETDLLVTGSPTAEAALELMKERRFDVMVADKNLPAMSGVELIEAARKVHPMLECVMITGYPSAESIIGAFAAGASDYLLKPFENIQVVRAKVRAALNRRSERAKSRESARADGRQAHQLLAEGKDAPEPVWQKLEAKLHGYESAIQAGGASGHVAVVGSTRVVNLLNAGGIDVERADPGSAALATADVVVIETTVKNWRELAERVRDLTSDVVLVAGGEADLADLLDAIALRLDLVGFDVDAPGIPIVERVRAHLLRRGAERAHAELVAALTEFKEALRTSR